MALIHCPECGKEMSDQLWNKCPNCGYRNTTPNRKLNRRLIWITIIVFIIFIWVSIANILRNAEIARFHNQL